MNGWCWALRRCSLRVVLEHGEVDDPQEIPPRPLDPKAVGQRQPQRSEARLGDGLRVGHEQQQIPRLPAKAFNEGLCLLLPHDLEQRRADAAIGIQPHREKSMSAEHRGFRREVVDVLAGEPGCTLGADTADDAAIGHRFAEHAELRGAGDVADVHDLHAEAKVGLVAAVPRHDVGVLESWEGQRQVDCEGLFERGGEHALDHVLDVLFIDEAHLDVDLGVLGLAVGAQVFVAERAGDLVVALEAGDHRATA